MHSLMVDLSLIRGYGFTIDNNQENNVITNLTNRIKAGHQYDLSEQDNVEGIQNIVDSILPGSCKGIRSALYMRTKIEGKLKRIGK